MDPENKVDLFFASKPNKIKVGLNPFTKEREYNKNEKKINLRRHNITPTDFLKKA